MHRWLTEILICPECLPQGISLSLKSDTEQDGDVIHGELACPSCRTIYPIREGVAVILPKSTLADLHHTGGYNSDTMLSAYMWSHFSDLFNDPEATSAYGKWAALLGKERKVGYALDIGCAVGRLSFELSTTHSHVVGIDTSLSFIRKARKIKTTGALSFDLIIEGLITEGRSCSLEGRYPYDRIEFVVADALALPFRPGLFSTVTSINILEKVPSPLKHLMDVNRVMKEENGVFVFSDPFSWDESVSAPEHWLSAGKNSNGHLRGMESMTAYFQGKDHVFNPPMAIREKGKVSWKIRKTENLWEHITSEYMVGER